VSPAIKERARLKFNEGRLHFTALLHLYVIGQTIYAQQPMNELRLILWSQQPIEFQEVNLTS